MADRDYSKITNSLRFSLLLLLAASFLSFASPTYAKSAGETLADLRRYEPAGTEPSRTFRPSYQGMKATQLYEKCLHIDHLTLKTSENRLFIHFASWSV